MLKIAQLRLAVGQPESRLPELAAQKLHIKPEQLLQWQIVHKSVDARQNPTFILFMRWPCNCRPNWSVVC